MARPTERRKTQREQVELGNQRPVQLQSDRRFYQGGGYDKSVRAARALEQAFGTVARDYTDIKNSQNADARQRALNENAAGQQRDVDEKNNAYHRQWDMLNAEYDFQKLAVSLPDALREKNWEDMPEADVQGLISSTMSGLFKGVENLKDSAYAEYLAPKLLELETGLITQHRQYQIEKVKEELRTQSYATFTGDYETRFKDWQEAMKAGTATMEDRPVADYQTLFGRTGTFFDGNEKKTVFWESIYDLAIQMGDSSIIDNVPAQLLGTSGAAIPSGIEDPALQDAHRAAKQAADTVGAKRAAAAEAEQTLAWKRQVFDLQHLIAIKTIAGQDVSEELALLRDNPVGSYSDFTSARNFARTERNDAEERVADLPTTAMLWNGVYGGKYGLNDIFDAWGDGVFGSGPQAVAQMEKMMETVKQVRDASLRSDSTLLSQTRQSIAANYNPQREGLLKGINVDLMYIQQQAVDEFNRLTLVDGVPPLDASMQVREKYDPMVDRLSNAQSGTKWSVEAGVITAQSVQGVLNGDISPEHFVGPNTKKTIEESLYDLAEKGEISTDEAAFLMQALY